MDWQRTGSSIRAELPSEVHPYSELKLEDFARLFGTTVDDIPDDCRELISKNDFRYEILVGEERDKVLLDVLKKIEQQTGGRISMENAWYPLTTIVEFGRVIAVLPFLQTQF